MAMAVGPPKNKGGLIKWMGFRKAPRGVSFGWRTMSLAL